MRARSSRRRAVALAAVPLSIIPVACTEPGPPKPPPTSGPTPSTPPPATCQTIDYQQAKVVPVSRPNALPSGQAYQLVVTGELPYANWSAKLNPHVYVRQPEYWGIEVQGCRSLEVGLPMVKPFTLTLDLGATSGTEGIEVIGATKHERFDLPPDRPG